MPRSEALTHARGELPRSRSVNHARNTRRQRTIEKREKKFGRRPNAISRPGNGHRETGNRIDAGAKLHQSTLRRCIGDLGPTGVNTRRDSRSNSRHDQLTRQLNRRSQEWERVAEHRAADRRIVAGKFLVTVGGQTLVSAELEQNLRRRLLEESAGVPSRVQLKWTDLTPRRQPKLQSLPAKISIGALVVNPHANSTVHEHAADLGIEIDRGDRSEIISFADAPVRPKTFARSDEYAARNIVFHGMIAPRSEFQSDKRLLLGAERSTDKRSRALPV